MTVRLVEASKNTQQLAVILPEHINRGSISTAIWLVCRWSIPYMVNNVPRIYYCSGTSMEQIAIAARKSELVVFTPKQLLMEHNATVAACLAAEDQEGAIGAMGVIGSNAEIEALVDRFALEE